MTARRRFRAPVGRAQRSPTNWARDVGGEVTTLAGVSAIMTTVVLSNPGINETVRRTRGNLTVHSAAAGRVFGAFGAIVVNDSAIAAGISSIPEAIDNASDDGWFMWETFSLEIGSVAAINSQRVDFDSKAMRRIVEGFGVAFMIQVDAGSTAAISQLNVSLLTSLT